MGSIWPTNFQDCIFPHCWFHFSHCLRCAWDFLGPTERNSSHNWPHLISLSLTRGIPQFASAASFLTTSSSRLPKGFTSTYPYNALHLRSNVSWPSHALSSSLLILYMYCSLCLEYLFLPSVGKDCSLCEFLLEHNFHCIVIVRLPARL